MSWLDGIFKLVTSGKALVLAGVLGVLLLKKFLGLTQEEIEWAFITVSIYLGGQSVVDAVQSWRGSKVPMSVTDSPKERAAKQKTISTIAKG